VRRGRLEEGRSGRDQNNSVHSGAIWPGLCESAIVMILNALILLLSDTADHASTRLPKKSPEHVFRTKSGKGRAIQQHQSSTFVLRESARSLILELVYPDAWHIGPEARAQSRSTTYGAEPGKWCVR